MKHTFPLLPSYLRSHICSFRSPKQVSLQAGARPASAVGARNVVPGSSVVASKTTCQESTSSAHFTLLIIIRHFVLAKKVQGQFTTYAHTVNRLVPQDNTKQFLHKVQDFIPHENYNSLAHTFGPLKWLSHGCGKRLYITIV